MPKGPRGEKRPADAVARAVMVAKIATGEIEDERDDVRAAAVALGSKGGQARARKLTGAERPRAGSGDSGSSAPAHALPIHRRGGAKN